MKKYCQIAYILAFLGLFLVPLLAGCSASRFNINDVDFSYETAPQYILPLKYHDRSNLSPETSGKIMKGILSKDSNSWGYYYIHHDFNRSEKKLFDIGSLELVIDALHILGFPKARVNYDLKAYAYLFDSNGDIIEIYEKSSCIMKYKGWYYGYDVPVKDMSSEYKKMFQDMISDISSNRDRTNHLLKSAGALHEEKTAEVYTKIYMIIK